MSNISLSLDNPYGNVTIPRAKLRGEGATVIANPGATKDPPPYTVREVAPEEGGGSGRCAACCYRCRRK